MSILSTNSRLIKVGQDYSAGAGISIDDHVISVTGDTGTTYSAGENISIYEQDEQLYISSKDWTNDIANASANAYNAATAQIPEPQDLSYISSKVDDKLDSTAFTNWQTGQYTTDLQTIEGQITNKLDTSSFSDVSGSFLTAINIPESATWNEVSQAYEQASGTYLTSVSIPESATWEDVSTTVQSNSAQWAEGGTGGDPEVNSFVYNNSANILDVDTTYQENSASYLTSHQDISYKLDTTAFSTVSGDFLTAAPANMATTGDIADLAQSVSETYYPNTNPSSFVNGDWVTAQGYITGVDLSEYAKRDFVLSSIESAASSKLDVSSFSTVSSDFLTNEDLNGYATTAWVDEQGYLTAHQDISNKLDVSAFSDVSGSFLTAHQDLSDYATTAQLESTSSFLSGAIDYVSANAGGNVPVSNSGNLYKVELSGVDLYGYKKTTTIPTEPFYSAVSSQETQYIQYTPYPQWNNYAIQDLRNWSAFDIITVSSNGNEIRPVGYPYGITALNVYYQANYVYDSNNNQLPDFSGYIGKITLDNLVISSYFDKPSYFNDIERCSQFRLWFSGNQHEGQLNNNHYICSVGTEVQSDPETIEGIFVPSATDLSNYYTKSETSGASEIADALANIPTGNPEVENYVQTNSANIDDTVTSYQTNSGDFLTAAPADMATTGDVAELAQSVSETYQVKGDYLTTADSANFYPANNPSSFATENWVTEQGYITGAEIVNHDNTLSGNGTVDSPLGVMLSATNDANVNNIVVTASLPSTPDANTLYLIPEA